MDGTYLTVSCIDTGVGIKNEDINNLFTMFGYIKDSQLMNVHGIGLGLNLSKKIIDQFDGKMEVESFFGEGSTFKFILKLFEEDDLEIIE